MRFFFLAALGFSLAQTAFGQGEFLGAPVPVEPPKPSPLSAEEERATFALPPGFEIELVAADPDISKVVTLAFDESGKMWAVTAVEYPVDENDNPAQPHIGCFLGKPALEIGIQALSPVLRRCKCIFEQRLIRR